MIEVFDIPTETGKNTHKEIGIEEVIDDALRHGVDTLCVISSGNYLRAILDEIDRRVNEEPGLEGKLRVVNLVNFEPIGKQKRHSNLLIFDNKILRDAAERERYVSDNLPSTGVVKDYTDFIPDAYRTLAKQILERNPDYIVLPVGSGKLFVAVYQSIKDSQLDTKILGIVPWNENGIFNEDQTDTHFLAFKGKSLADKLTTPYTFFRDEILKAIQEGHAVVQVLPQEIIYANQIALERGFLAEPSASVGFTLFDKMYCDLYNIDPDAHTIIVNTGISEANNFRRIDYFEIPRNFVLGHLSKEAVDFYGEAGYIDLSSGNLLVGDNLLQNGEVQPIKYLNYRGAQGLIKSMGMSLPSVALMYKVIIPYLQGSDNQKLRKILQSAYSFSEFLEDRVIQPEFLAAITDDRAFNYDTFFRLAELPPDVRNRINLEVGSGSTNLNLLHSNWDFGLQGRFDGKDTNDFGYPNRLRSKGKFGYIGPYEFSRPIGKELYPFGGGPQGVVVAIRSKGKTFPLDLRVSINDYVENMGLRPLKVT